MFLVFLEMGFLKKAWKGMIERAKADIEANRKKKYDDQIIRRGLLSEQEQEEMDEVVLNVFHKKDKKK